MSEAALKTVESPVKPAPLHASLWRIVVDPIEIQRYYEGGKIELPDSVIDAQQYLRYVGRVVDIGPLAFTAEQFRDHDGNLVKPCEVGDWIIYSRNTGVEIYTQTDKPGEIRQLRIINDDHVLGVVDDIDKIKIPLR
jgi:hypothetical protein